MSSGSQTDSFIHQHPALFASLGVLVLIGIRLLVVSRSSPTTAAAILRDVGTTNVAISIVLSLIPSFLGFPVALCASWIGTLRFSEIKRDLSPVIILMSALLSSVFLAYALLSRASFLIILGTAVVVFLTRRFAKSLFEPLGNRTTQWLVVIAMTSALALPAIISPRPWLPLEEITTDDKKSVRGYVLKEGPIWTSVLRESDAEVFQVRTSTIEDREFCRPLGSTDPRPYFGRLDAPSYPEC